MRESDAIHLVCYMVLEYSGASVLHGTNKFWNYRNSMTGPMSLLRGVAPSSPMGGTPIPSCGVPHPVLTGGVTQPGQYGVPPPSGPDGISPSRDWMGVHPPQAFGIPFSIGGFKWGTRDAHPPLGPNSFIFMQYVGKNCPNIGLLPHLGSWRPPVWEILDPSLLCVLGCLVFVCLSLVEAAVVTYVENISISDQQSSHDDGKTCDSMRDSEQRVKLRLEGKQLVEKQKAHILHKMSRVLFPVAFVVFNAIYWGYYL